MASQEEGHGASAPSGRAEVVKRARERTALELTRRSIDLTTGSPRATMVAAVAVAAAVPLVDASHLLDGLMGASNLPVPEAVDRFQQSGCKRHCGGG